MELVIRSRKLILYNYSDFIILGRLKDFVRMVIH